MGLEARKVLDDGKIVGTKVKVERGERGVFYLNICCQG